MQQPNRRTVLGSIALFATVGPTAAGTPEQISLEAEEGGVTLTRYAADQVGKRAGVLVLHGSRGFERKPAAYQRYADALNAAGIDAYMVRYFTNADPARLEPQVSTGQSRNAYEAARYGSWTRRVSSVVTAALARPENSGRIGLLGFSLGGYVAAATAAHDQRIAALAVLYGGMPDAGQGGGIHLGVVAPRGEKGVLTVSPGDFLRISWNPFFPYVEERVRRWIAR